MKPIINVQNVWKNFNSLEVLQGVSFEAQAGEIIAIIGPSGSGKTTLLRCINGLINIDQGKIKVTNLCLTSQNNDAPGLRKKVGLVFQQFNLCPNKTVLENIIKAPVIANGLKKSEAVKRAQVVLEWVGLKNKSNEYPYQLSGGQQQRAAIARALVMEPEILLFDEITSALDPELTIEVLNVIKNLAKEKKYTFLIVTHELSFVRQIADRIIFMDKGKIIEQGEPKKFFNNPEQKRTQQFLEHVYLNKTILK